MRLPKRIQGVILGSALLIAGPVVAVELVSAPAAAPPAVKAAPVAAVDAVGQTIPEPKLHMLRSAPPIPPSAPTPAPTATPRPAPLQHTKPQQSAPAPVPAASYPAGSVQAIITAAANRWGVSPSWMISIARCESGLRPNAYNPSGPYYGLFQFLMSTFTHNGGSNIWDPADQANIAAKMLAHGQAHQWSCA